MCPNVLPPFPLPAQILSVLHHGHSHPLFLPCARSLQSIASTPFPPQVSLDALAVMLQALRQLPGDFPPRQASLVAACLAAGFVTVRSTVILQGPDDADVLHGHLMADKAAVGNLLNHGALSPDTARQIQEDEFEGWTGLPLEGRNHLPGDLEALQRCKTFWHTPRMACLHALSLEPPGSCWQVLLQALPAAWRLPSGDMVEWMLQSAFETRAGA